MNPIPWIRNSIKVSGISGVKLPMPIRAYSAGPRQVPVEWLRRVVEDRTEPPKLYAWTLENLPGGANSKYSPSAEGVSKLDDERRRIYVLGVGNIGRLYASCLSKHTSRPPITLVVHRQDLLEHWQSQPGIELVRDGKAERNAAFDIEWWTDAKPPRGPVEEPGAGAKIANLLVATKAPDALPQIDRVRGYLDASSTVAFAQNGMCKLWPPLGDAYVAARFPAGASPTWLACVTTHGVTSLGPFRSVHASPATVLVGTVMAGRGGVARSDTNYLAEKIASAPGLAGRRVSTRELWVSQLEKLVVNSVINPLTAVLRCKNGEIFVGRNDGLSSVIDALLGEASRTLTALVEHPSTDSILLPQMASENQNTATGATTAESPRRFREELVKRFSFPRLRAMIYSVGEKVAENTSSMLQDVRAGKKTEVKDFNGWLVETAKYLGHECGLPAHEKMISLVLDGVTLSKGELSRHILKT
ncbi:6-phosphogluconate dehydrogenase C-terminal domain-like protein [Hypomontagnella submonticulosa]|nr:6-phosphogluconate dehydrogenase C-terminal domain-like protein [Hypomontagnella submonticulosa]